MPLRGLGITGNQALEVGERILFCARCSPRWFNDLAGHHIKIDEPGQGAMADLLELASQHMARLHGQIGMLPLQGLHARQFVHAQSAFSEFRS